MYSFRKRKDPDPDYTNILQVLYNEKPGRLPLYEHIIDEPFVSRALGKELTIEGNKPADLEHYYSRLINFWKDCTYDAFAYEAGICDILPGHGAIKGGMPGPVQTREDFEKYPFEDIPKIFWKEYTPHLDAIRKVMPDGMKAYGGCGYGIFETSEDLVGYEYLCVMQHLDPELFRDIYLKIGELFRVLWSEMIKRYGDLFVFYRMGDDLGFKSNTLIEPDAIRKHIIPQYKKVIDLAHSDGKKFLLHSCGHIFSVMDQLIEAGIDAKHSNEDNIASFDKWIELYNDRIGLFGGIDVNVLCLNDYDEVYRIVLNEATRFRSMAKGWGLGSGNSIAYFVPVDGFMAMIDAAREIRRRES
jgi:hypothetical protein